MVERSDPPRYVSDSAGAPPVPPPGGYRGAARATGHGGALATPGVPARCRRPRDRGR
jgi:hypothetical protein